MNIVALMPIKLRSKRFPYKNIKLLHNKPLLQYNLEMLLCLKNVNDIFVYCSDESVCELLPQKIKFLKRPSYLDSDNTNFTQIFECFMKEVNADIYLFSHATAPFVSMHSAQKCLDSVLSGKYDSAFTAIRIQDFLWTNDLKPLHFNPKNLPRSQDLPILYKESSGIYVFTKEVFVNLHQRIGQNPNIIEVDFRESIDINEESDFKLAEMFVNIQWGGVNANS